MTTPIIFVSPLNLSIISISIYASLLSIHVVECGRCLGHQQSLLLQLKHTLIFNKTTSKALVKWKESSDCCTWPGITCDNDGRVIGLELSQESITGGIMDNSTLFKLVYLERLDLSSNNLSTSGPVISSTNFRGRLPPSIGNLVRLSELVLCYCQFSGPLPKSIASLTQLVHLDLSDNSFTGPLPPFHLFKNLFDINLSNNRFTGQIPLAHREGFLNLVIVDLRNNFLNGTIPSSLFSHPSLRTIDLSSNQFGGQLVEFPNATSSVLDTINLSSNNLSGRIPLAIFKISTLQSLSLSSNKFNGTIQLLDIFQDLPSLYNLYLSDNNLSINASRHSNFSSDLPDFDELGLASCNLGTFPHLESQSEVHYLDLSNNHIHGEVPNWIWEIMDFDGILKLSHNHLVGLQEPFSLEIDTVDLSFNQLGKIPLQSMYPAYLDLSNNNFTSSIPSDVGHLFYDTHYFSLANNGLTGVIPESMCGDDYIEIIDLSNNSLNGSLPKCMQGGRFTRVLNLQTNNLSGRIPDVFPVRSSLQILDLNGNLLTGTIPKSLANCKALKVLNLGNNEMFDTFPLFLKNIPTLQVLVLRSNKLYGRIRCGDNIGDWPEIQILNVASNNFSGELPSKCLTKWHAMRGIEDDVQSPPDMADTSPSYFYYNYEDAVTVTNKHLEMELKKISTGFTAIDFSSNNFQGEIPKELGQLNYLIVLNLSNNALSGHIPSSFGEMQQLESLDLSRNRLNGDIPTSLSNLNFLAVLDLSHNHLLGRIPMGTQIQTFSADCFQGNEGLCGPPLTLNCPGDVTDMPPEPAHEARHSNYGSGIKWDLISAEVGFIVGFGGVIGPLAFSKRWRKYYYDGIEDVAFSILPQLVLEKWLSWKFGVRK